MLAKICGELASGFPAGVKSGPKVPAFPDHLGRPFSNPSRQLASNRLSWRNIPITLIDPVVSIFRLVAQRFRIW